MAKYVLKTHLNHFNRICEDTESRDWWMNNFSDITSYHEISDADYTALQKATKEFSEYNPLNTTLVDSGISEQSFTKDEIIEDIVLLKDKITKAIQDNENPPAIWTTNLNALNAINFESLTYPVSGINPVDCLIKNGIQVPSSMEF